MKILLITRYYPPLKGVATVRMSSFAEHWRSQGHTVTVLTTRKAMESEALPEDVHEVPYFDPISFVIRNEKRPSDTFKGRVAWSKIVEFYRTRMNERLPSRVDSWILGGRRVIKKWKKEGKEFDLIVSSYGPPAAHLLGRFAKKLYQIPWIADFRDLWTENHTYSGLFPFTLLERYLEKQVLKDADLITTVSEGLQKKLQAKASNKRVVIVRNGYVDFEKSKSSKKNKRCTITYTGTLFSKGHHVTPFFEALRLLKNEHPSLYHQLHVQFAGAGSPAFFEELNGSSVQFLGEVNHLQSLQLQSESDLLLYIQFKGLYDGLLSAKIYEYLYQDVPLFAIGVPKDGELENLLKRAGGTLFIENKANTIKEQLVQFIKTRTAPGKKLGFYSNAF